MHYHYNGEMNCIRGIWRAHGRGTCYYPGGYPDGAVAYDGNHVNGKYHGQGTSHRPDGTKEYEGQWKEGYWHGHGTLFCPDGITHAREDDWRKGDSCSYKDGSRYEGEWRNDGNQRHRWGIQYRPDGTKEYEGQWKEGYWHGHGTLFCPDGITHAWERDWRKGDSLLYKDGSRYEGEWDDDGEQRHGWGILYDPNLNIVYEGWWQNGDPSDGPPPDRQDTQ